MPGATSTVPVLLQTMVVAAALTGDDANTNINPKLFAIDPRRSESSTLSNDHSEFKFNNGTSFPILA
ncbi:hypothetical protein CVT25_003054 [Psilocybe cyanescens]|uniref:Uncharacterized protein n=1 Tax=Psilocybe cyanescens TaxID=93625 RepID=A0A409WNB9_PSICY|nr:hypothetical protein CVT25_003054 [Psilocybe cyanescens]